MQVMMIMMTMMMTIIIEMSFCGGQDSFSHIVSVQDPLQFPLVLIGASLAELQLAQDLPEDLDAVAVPAGDVAWTPRHQAVPQLLLNPSQGHTHS